MQCALGWKDQGDLVDLFAPASIIGNSSRVSQNTLKIALALVDDRTATLCHYLLALYPQADKVDQLSRLFVPREVPPQAPKSPRTTSKRKLGPDANLRRRSVFQKEWRL